MSRYTSRATGPLTREETDVRAALAFNYTTADATRIDRVRSAVLWRAYTDWWAANRWRWKRPYDVLMGEYPPLTRKQFGAAVRRVFPGVVRDKQMLGRKKFYVYRGLRAAD